MFLRKQRVGVAVLVSILALVLLFMGCAADRDEAPASSGSQETAGDPTNGPADLPMDGAGDGQTNGAAGQPSGPAAGGQADGTKDAPVDGSSDTPMAELTAEQALELEGRFFAGLFRLAIKEDTYEVEDYPSKEALIEAVSEVADRGLVAEYVDSYFTEEDGKLLIVPTEAPSRILPESPYEFRQIDTDTYEIVQSEQNELMGAYTLTVQFARIDGEWKIADRRLELK